MTSVYNHLNSMVHAGSCKVVISDTCSQCQECCTGTNYLKLTRHLKQLGLFPMIKNVSQIRPSVFEFVKMLKAPCAATQRYDTNTSHVGCNALLDDHHDCHIEANLVVLVDQVLIKYSEKEPMTSSDVAAYMKGATNSVAYWDFIGQSANVENSSHGWRDCRDYCKGRLGTATKAGSDFLPLRFETNRPCMLAFSFVIDVVRVMPRVYNVAEFGSNY